MSRHLSLANRYRPQTFAEVIGQSGATAALSRAAAEDRVAPAYLLSGTRGVGKTTIARIFAKALNCEHAPAAEPCNNCVQCAQILDGSHVDVCEIDGASNTGVDDVRALRDNLGFMPMQGRYKVFIIDEAHMLSKSAFNALLKTLEEPPAHTVFIFATTEAHRFPATIISRCQHFVFRHLPEDEITRHLADILEKEKISFDAPALRLIAKRAAGSMRDSLSLLDQTLAAGSGRLDETLARNSLGLAGQEFFTSILAAIAEGNCASVLNLCQQLLRSGADIGYFMRELAAWERNMFLYSQEGKKILPQLALSEDEGAALAQITGAFNASRLHAAWQMTLEAQRSIAASPEPGTALELHLLNLTLLPRLMPTSVFLEKAPAQDMAEKAVPEKKNLIDPGQKTADENDSGIPAAKLSENYNAWRTQEISKPETAETCRTGQDSGNEASWLNTPHLFWEQFCEFCQLASTEEEFPPRDLLRGLQSSWDAGGTLCIRPANSMLEERLNKKKPCLEKALRQFCGANMPAFVYAAAPATRNRQELLRQGEQLPEVQLCKDILGASLTDCREIGQCH